tara:strand:+ start:54 stop:491 length:438 start_codon:yes stop_codon:yes gene_type:complete
MKLIAIDLIFTILQYCKNVNLLLNKEYFEKIKDARKHFLIFPLLLEYRILQYKKKRENDIYPKIHVRKKQITRLNGSIPLGIIYNNNIIASNKLRMKLIPTKKKFVYPYYLWGYYSSPYLVIDYDLYDIQPVNMSRAIFYKQLFN